MAVATRCTWQRTLVIAAIAGCATVASAARAEDSRAGSPIDAKATPPEWAYPWAPDYHYPPDNDHPRHVSGSSLTFAASLMSDPFFTVDWHPDDHAPMPSIVARGRAPAVRACGSCHRADGTGAPENASLAGLPAAYIERQMADFGSGARRSAVPHRSTVRNMVALAQAATDEDVRAAATYLASLRPRANIDVVEAAAIPRVYVARMSFALDPAGGTEPLGRRIIEVPRSLEDVENNDSHATFIAYVPPGSIAEGAALVKTGGDGLTVPCETCHGPGLLGTDSVPRLAGRSPSYLVRQLYDFQQGLRAGPDSTLMQPVVARLSVGEMIVLAAYAASLSPR